MTARSLLCLAASCLALTSAGDASAGVWRWGCSGPVGAEHVVFNRFQMLKLPLAIDAKHLLSILFLDDMRGDAAVAKVPAKDIAVFTVEDANSGLAETLTFLPDDPSGEKITLTETASKVLSDRKVPGCRDERTTRFRKVYRLESGHAAARRVTLECYDYTLSTRGGRPCD